MTTKPSKSQTGAMPDPPRIKHPTEAEAPHLYENGVYYPSAVNGPLIDPPSEADAPHLYENGVCYPETDGVPLPDAITQGLQFRALVTTLRGHYVDQPRTHVNGNTFIYYDEGTPRRSISPDCYVAFDVDVDIIIDVHNSYRIWAVGKPPDFVMEIASQSTFDNDLHPKRELYAIIGIGEYWRYDPTPDSEFYGEPLVGERLIDGEYQRMPIEPDNEGRPRGHSPVLGLDFVWENGDLRMYDPVTGEWLRHYEEMQTELVTERTAREVAESMLETAQSQLESEQAARETAEARIARLEAELHRLRGE